MSEWLDLMLEEIERKKKEAGEARAERARRDDQIDDQRDDQQSPDESSPLDDASVQVAKKRVG